MSSSTIRIRRPARRPSEAALAEVDHAGGAHVLDRLVVIGLDHPSQALHDPGHARDLAADGVDPLELDTGIPLARERVDVPFQQLGLVEHHGQRIVDLVGEAHGDLAQRRELVLVQDLTQVLREPDGAVLAALFVVEQRARDRHGDLLTGLGQVGGLEARADAGTTGARVPHRLHHALRLGDVGVEPSDEGPQDLLGPVAEDLRRAVVVVGHETLAVRGANDVGGARDEALELLLREAHARSVLLRDEDHEPGLAGGPAFVPCGPDGPAVTARTASRCLRPGAQPSFRAGPTGPPSLRAPLRAACGWVPDSRIGLAGDFVAWLESAAAQPDSGRLRRLAGERGSSAGSEGSGRCRAYS
jgi:hypothetical protein